MVVLFNKKVKVIFFSYVNASVFVNFMLQCLQIVAELAVGEHQTCVQVSPSSRKLYSGGVDGSVCVWDREARKLWKHYKASFC